MAKKFDFPNFSHLYVYDSDANGQKTGLSRISLKWQ